MKSSTLLIIAIGISLFQFMWGGCFNEDSFPCLQGCDEDYPARGVNGLAVFEFSQYFGDFSESSGKAFAVGTISRLRVYGYELPASGWHVESGNSDIATVERFSEDESYPVVLAMLSEGSAQIKVVNDLSNEIFDYIIIRVEEPEDIKVFVHDRYTEGEPSQNPILITTGVDCGSCEMLFHLYNSVEGDESWGYLFGEYVIGIEETVEGLDFIVTNNLVEVSASAAVDTQVTFQGPEGLSLTEHIKAVTTSDISELRIVYYNAGGDEVMNVGEWGTFSAIQTSIYGNLCSRGYPTVFETDDETIISLNRTVQCPDSVEYDLLAPGMVKITAYLEANPDIKDVININVE